MPLTHIQLRPKKDEDVLGRALKKEKPKKVFGPTYVPREIKPYAGPTPTLDGGVSPLAAGYEPRAPSALTRALAPTGPAPDIQAEAWARRKEIVAEEQTRLDTEADALYGAVQDLSPEDQAFILSKVVEKGRPSALTAALGISSEGRTIPLKGGIDPLMQTLIDKNYIRPDASGETYSWMLPEEEEEREFLRAWEDPDRPGKMVKMYKDGTIEHTDEPMPKIEPTPQEEIQTETLRQLKETYGERYTTQALQEQGAVPIPGVTMIPTPITTEFPNGTRLATQADVEAYWIRVSSTADRLRRLAEGEPFTMEDVEETYKDNPEAIKNVQKALGIEPVTGILDSNTKAVIEKMFSGYATGGAL